jgi:choline dehydrogenase-like flavoprotein
LHYPGPVSQPQSIAKPIKPLDPLSLVTHQSSLECEVVVIGSGAGGGVIAGELARAGKDVIVLERGGYYNEADFDQYESEQSRQLFWDGARLVTQDSAVSILAGSCLGGGTTINWCASFRPPQTLRERWEQEHGLEGVASAEFDVDIDAVCERLHVGKAESFINAQNEKLLRGAQALGYHVDTIARNVSECGHGEDCGYCTFGCVRGAKQSTLVTYLQDAAHHGARFIVNAEAQRIVIEHGRAVGVEVVLYRDDGSGKLIPLKQAITVRAKAIVVAAGSIGSPALLLRSGLKHPHLGRHLHLHPTSFVFGVYNELIEAWQGVPLSIVCDQFADLNDGYGFALEVPPLHTSVPAVAIPWTGGHDYKMRMAQLAHTAAFITLVKDRDGGRVTINKKGQPLIDYWLSEFDRAQLVRAMQAAARTHIAAGAREVYSAHTPPVAWQQGEPVEPFIEEFAHARYEPHRVLIGSAHQMGTCRMGRDAKESVADTHGEVHGIKGLWIGDASAFPTASGVNPMITIMALAQRTARYIQASL